MPKGAWSAKDERQYKHIVKSCTARKKCKTKKCKTTCTRIAAATVNKGRQKRGETAVRGLADCGCQKALAAK